MFFWSYSFCHIPSSHLAQDKAIHTPYSMSDYHCYNPNRYSNGGIGYYYCFIRLFSKAEVKAGLNNEQVLLEWLKLIRDDFCATRARYEFRLEVGGLLGRSEARFRALDTLLLDRDIAEYARMFYG